MKSTIGPGTCSVACSLSLIALATWALAPLTAPDTPDREPQTRAEPARTEPQRAAFTARLWRAPDPAVAAAQPEAPTAPPPAKVIPPLNLRLLAITSERNGAERAAMCFDPDRNRVISLRERDVWRERVVSSVASDRVVLAGPHGDEVLALRSGEPAR